MKQEQTPTPSIERVELPPLTFRRPDPADETDRIGREIVRRMIEAGVVEP